MSKKEPNLAYRRMAEAWALPDALWADTAGMRKAKEIFLPSRKGEKTNGALNDNYFTRLNETTLTNYFRPAVKNLVSKVFEKPIIIGENIAYKSDWWSNVDLMGSNLNDFAQEVFESAARVGLTYILVDAPNDEESSNLAEQKAKNIRPYMTHVEAKQLKDWEIASVNNLPTLTRVWIEEGVSGRDDDGVEIQIDQVREIGLDGTGSCYYTITQEVDGNDTVVEEGAISLPYIPLVPIYTNRAGFMEGESYFTTLCNLNLAHWQSSSYQRNILNVARVPRLATAGLNDDDVKAMQLHGAANGIHTSKEASQVRVEWVEAKGDSIQHGERDLAALEAQMEKRSLDPVLKTASSTDVATIANIEQSKTNSVLQAWAESLQRGLIKSVVMMHDLAGEPLEAPELTVNDDFSIVDDVAKVAEQLLKEHQGGAMSLRELLTRYKAIGHRDDDFDIDAELERLQLEVGSIDFSDE